MPVPIGPGIVVLKTDVPAVCGLHHQLSVFWRPCPKSGGLKSVLKVIIPILVATVVAGTLALGIGLLVTMSFALLIAGIHQNCLFGQLARTCDLTVMFPEEV